jgi:protein phosphatase
MKIRVGAATDVGRQRERNEDSYLSTPPLYAVADGMGGHRGGNVASSIAMRVLARIAQPGNWPQLGEQVRQANRAILQQAHGDRTLSGMGTTLTAAFMDGDEVHLAHVGDSRAYLLRGGQLGQITEDHTLVHRMVQEGKITEEEAEHHPQRSILIRALGVEDPVEVDETNFAAQEGDRVLLCSDGLYSMVGDQQIKDVLTSTPNPQEASDKLVELANGAGGQDNITVVILDFEPGEGVEILASSDGLSAAEASLDGITTPSFEPAPSEPAAGGGAPAMPGARPDETTSVPAMPSPAPRQGETTIGTVPRPQTPPPAFEPARPDQPFSGSLRRRREEATRPKRKRHFGRWIAALIAVLALAAVGARLYLDTQWFVSAENGHVAVFRGIPSELLGKFHLYGVVAECTDLSAAKAEKLRAFRDLEKGETAGSEDEARAIVDSIRKQLGVQGGGTQGAGKTQLCG